MVDTKMQILRSLEVVALHGHPGFSKLPNNATCTLYYHPDITARLPRNCYKYFTFALFTTFVTAAHISVR